MMHLKKYNHFNSFFSFNLQTGEAYPVDKKEGGYSGFLYTLPDKQVAALYKEKEVLTLQIGLQKWPFSPAISTSHEHVYGGKTVFAIYDNGKKIYEYTYPSWWLQADMPYPPALGEFNDDEEDDFLGWVHSVFEDEKNGIKRGLNWRSL